MNGVFLIVCVIRQYKFQNLFNLEITKELVDKCPDFSQSTKLVIYLDGRYVLLHCDSADGGDFTCHRSAHSLINFIHDAVILAWANAEA